MFACIHSKKPAADVSLSDFAYGFSPFVEETDSQTVVVDTEGCELLYGSAYGMANEVAFRASKSRELGVLGFSINVAIAANPDAAILAARSYEGISFVAPGEELTALGDLPLEVLLNPEVGRKSRKPKDELRLGDWRFEQKQLDEIQETLRLWGVHTLGQFAALPLNGLSERLGQSGVKLQQLASGKTERHLRLKQVPPLFSQYFELEYPLSELEPLSFIFARLLNQLCAALNAHALATNELRLLLKLENQELHSSVLNLPYPMRDNKNFLKLLLLDLETHPPQSPVIAVTIECDPVKPRVLQNGLFIPLAPEPEKLELTLKRLAKLLGPENVGSPELLDTHRPDAYRIRRFALSIKETRGRRTRKSEHQVFRSNRQSRLGFRMFRPPLRAVVDASRGCPMRISAWGKKLSVHGKIVRAAGPWRTTGDWWQVDSWARDEWDVAVESGNRATKETSAPTLYRIYRELRHGSWFVEGSYD